MSAVFLTSTKAARGVRYGTILIKSGTSQWHDVLATTLIRSGENGEDFGTRIKAVNRSAEASGRLHFFPLYDGGFPNFHQADHGSGVVYGTITFQRGSTAKEHILAEELGDPHTPDALFRAVNDWATRRGYVAALPTFMPGGDKVYGSILVKRSAVDWRDIPAVELGNPTSVEARFSAVNDWAARYGYLSAFPNFYEADYGTDFGTILLRSGAVDWRDIPAVELGNPTSVEARFRAVNDWATRNGYLSGFPNFHEANYGSGTVYGAILLKRGSADWRDIRASELY